MSGHEVKKVSMTNWKAMSKMSVSVDQINIAFEEIMAIFVMSHHSEKYVFSNGCIQTDTFSYCAFSSKKKRLNWSNVMSDFE